MRLLLTGANGLVGSRLVADLTRAGHRITAVWHDSDDRLVSNPPANLRYERLDLSDAVAVGDLFDRSDEFDAVIHTAAAVAARDDQADYLQRAARANVLSQVNLVAAAIRAGLPRFVFTSTISVYGGSGAAEGGYLERNAAPSAYYGWTKLAAEEWLDVAAERDRLTSVSLRLAGVHGCGRSTGALAAMTRAARNGEPINVQEPDSRFRWVFVEDVSQGVTRALTARLAEGHHVVNLASEDVFTLRQLAKRVRVLTGSDSTLQFAEGAKSRSEVMNIDRARELLGFAPTRLDVALNRYLEWSESN